MSPEEGTTIHRSTIELLDKLDKYLKQRDDYKAQRDTLIDDIAVLRANNERLERENEQYIKLLKEFNNLINYKLAIHPGSDVYMYYRSELNKLGVK